MPDVSLPLLRAGSFINGEWLDGLARSYPVYCPADGSLLAHQPYCGDAEAAAALKAAEVAFRRWRKTLAAERADFLQHWYALICQHREQLARLICYEQGKPLFEAEAEVDYGAGFVRWFAELAAHDYGQVIPPYRPGCKVLSVQEPVGVAAVITPWNFPLAMLTRKIAPAVAAGCAVVAKPSEETPLSANALMLLAQRAGLPAGLVNVVSGDALAIGKRWLADERVRKFSFTGSTAVGKALLANCAETVKKASLELGGNAPFLVFADASPALALDAVMTAKFRNSGQSCIGMNRLYVEKSIYHQFIQSLIEKIKKLKVACGWEDGCQVGPLIDAQAIEKVAGLVAKAVSAGGILRCGGKVGPQGGLFFQPTLIEFPVGSRFNLADSTEDEFFSPVLICQPFENEDEALELANASRYGLAAYCCTSNVDRTWRVAEQLESGMIAFNSGTLSSASVPFGGVKQSGLGREGGCQGLAEYQQTKYLLLAPAEQ